MGGGIFVSLWALGLGGGGPPPLPDIPNEGMIVRGGSPSRLVDGKAPSRLVLGGSPSRLVR